jgi:multidrug resistance efflux pump
VVAWTADGLPVAAGEPVAKLEGFKKFEGKLSEAQDRLKFYEGELAKAQAKADAAAIQQAEKKVQEKKDKAAEATTGLEPFLIKAPAAGKVSMLVGPGAKVAAGDKVVRIEGGESALIATFDVGQAGTGWAEGAACQVAPKATPDKPMACEVETVEGSSVSVRLATGATVAPGAELVLLPAKK